MNKNLCKCCSQKPYDECCKPFHDGSLPENALQLMRSRYSAYALCLANYIMHTTHPFSPLFQHDIVNWTKEITKFSQNSTFENLEILKFQDGDKIAYVTFTAFISKGGKDNTFTEKSRFEKLGNKWYYIEGKVIKGKASQDVWEAL